MKEMKKPPIERKWYCCPVCHTKLIIYDNTAVLSGGLFIKCRTCKREIEIKV